MLKAATPQMGGEEAVKGMVVRTPLGRLGTTSDVADVVAFPSLARRSVGHGAGRRGIRWHQTMNSSERSNTQSDRGRWRRAPRRHRERSAILTSMATLKLKSE